MLTATVEKITHDGVGFTKRKYDPTALIGILVVALPTFIDQVLETKDLELTKWVVQGLRLLGVLIAAFGRSLIVRDGAQ